MVQSSFFPQLPDLTEQDLFVVLQDRHVVVRHDRLVWGFAELEHHLESDMDLLLIDSRPGGRFIAVNVRQDISAQLNAETRPLRSLLSWQDETVVSIAGRANQIVDWYGSHRYCGSCGAPTIPHLAQRALVCSECSMQFFPRINPCAIMLVVRGDEMLLARSSRFKTGYFSCLAGFVEIGETPEETVVREVKEEVGLVVKNVRYAKSQSWPFPSQLMLGFYADYESGELVLEEEEIEEAGWFNVNQLPLTPPANITIAGQLIDDFVNNVRHKT